MPIRSIWELFLTLIGRNEASDDDRRDGFVPSPLDLSVRVGHGGPDDEVARELAEIEDQAKEFEDRQPDT